MGLLDQVLGQVLGNLGSSSGPSRQPTSPGGMGSGLGGQLGSILNGQGGAIALAIISLLASKHGGSGAGGIGSVLGDLVSGRGGSSTSQDPPGSGSSSSGGFMNEIGGMLGGNAGGVPSAPPAGGGSGGGLGGILGGGALAGGLGELLNHFQQRGGGDVMNSWIGSGANHPIDPNDLEQHLGSGTVDDLSRQTGMDRGDLLSQLAQALPQVVDKLTPHGRLPTAGEASTWV